MKLLTLVLLVFTTIAAAWEVFTITVTAWEPDRTSAGYTSNTGARYQYNFRNVADRIRNQSDTEDRIQDKIHADKLVVQIDQPVGQHGVSIKFP